MTGQNLAITGLPRSGTSLLCKLLNAEANIAAINEPEEVFRIFLRQWWELRHKSDKHRAEQVRNYYQQLRSSLLAGQTIANKVADDTRITDQRKAWRPEVGNAEDFVLITKNTLVYTCNIDTLHQCEIQTTALVRHPYDSIASWQSSKQPNLAHLRKGELVAAKRSAPASFSAAQLALLKELERQPIASLARLCLVWNFLVTQYLERQELVNILSYESLVSDPAAAVGSVLPDRTTVVAKSDSLDIRTYDVEAAEREFIWSVCGENALQLGYSESRIGNDELNGD